MKQSKTTAKINITNKKFKADWLIPVCLFFAAYLRHIVITKAV